ncbi:limbic system-associated membrane protein-like isoform X2 [Mya arenaria]|uniref:limbic system-associated membrane protein-like isoform X2 n=1 Tax=Mya arenaria TaxID=6604 RepID=UPI0022DFCB80|nr:limbic system-associated membrane protein-like isoform X2 [Mya arenaria]
MDLFHRDNVWKITSILFSVLQLAIGQMPDFVGMGYGGGADSAPVLDTTPSTVTVKQGETAILGCHVRNTGNTSVMWSYGQAYKQISTDEDILVEDQRLSIQHRNNDEWNLVIKSVQFDDAKDYICTVLYLPPQEKYVTLHVFGLPQIDKDQLQDRYMFREGEPVAIECVVHGPDALQVHWYAFKTDQSSREEQKEQVSNNQYLRIGQMSRDTDGIYRCEASNKYGKDMYEILLQTSYAPVLRVLEKEAIVKLGHPVKLTCEADGRPLPNMAWYHRKSTISNNFKYHLAQYTESETKKVSELTIQLTEQEDMGLYVCSAANNNGRNDAEIKVTGKPTEQTSIKYDGPKTGESSDSSAIGVSVSKPIIALASLTVSYIIATVL